MLCLTLDVNEKSPEVVICGLYAFVYYFNRIKHEMVFLVKMKLIQSFFNIRS